MSTSVRTKKLVAGAVLVIAGFGAGAALAVSGSASAVTDTEPGSGEAGRSFDQGRSVRPDEHLLSGTTARKVRAAALARYPGATIQRVETDSDGVYEAHIVTEGGRALTVQVGKDFEVTGTEESRHGGPAEQHDGRGGQHSGPGRATPSGTGYGTRGQA
jgi:hypothetical protein